MNDPILTELWHVKDEMAKSCDYDLHTLFERLKVVQQAHPDRIVKFNPEKYTTNPCTLHVAEPSTPYLQ
jgi:hypothetical protein